MTCLERKHVPHVVKDKQEHIIHTVYQLVHSSHTPLRPRGYAPCPLLYRLHATYSSSSHSRSPSSSWSSEFASAASSASASSSRFVYESSSPRASRRRSQKCTRTRRARQPRWATSRMLSERPKIPNNTCVHSGLGTHFCCKLRWLWSVWVRPVCVRPRGGTAKALWRRRAL